MQARSTFCGSICGSQKARTPLPATCDAVVHLAWSQGLSGYAPAAGLWRLIH